MIRALSPYYVTVPLVYTKTCEYFKLNIKVWSGSELSVPSDIDYTIVYENTEASTGSHTINIAPLLRDFIEFVPLDNGNTFSILDGGENQKYFNYQVAYDDAGTTTSSVTKLFGLGYSYGNEGANASSRNLGPSVPEQPEQILMPLQDYSAYRGGQFCVPISLEDLSLGESSTLTVRSYPSLTQLSESQSLSYTTSSDSKIKYIWIPTNTVTSDEYIKVNWKGDTVYLILKDEFRFEPMQVHFINKLGGQQSFTFRKEQRESLNVTDNVFESNIGQPSTGSHQFLRYNVQGRKTIKASTGFIFEDENEVIKQMMLSERVWMYDTSNDFTPLNIKTTSTSFKSRQKERLINYDIEFEMGYNEVNNI